MASLKKCIENHCKNCSYDATQPGTWREQIEACTVKSCALWEVRPVTVATINLNRKHRNQDEIDGVVDSLEDEPGTEMCLVVA